MKKIAPKKAAKPKRVYATKYKPELCSLVIKLGKEGASKTELACACGISRETMNQWEKSNPDFNSAVQVAVQHAQVWWEKMGREATFGTEKFNATAYIFQMKNRFRDDYREKVEVAHTVGGIGDLIDEIQSK
jgi:DNA-binding XRE family transcriptional regulator